MHHPLKEDGISLVLSFPSGWGNTYSKSDKKCLPEVLSADLLYNVMAIIGQWLICKNTADNLLSSNLTVCDQSRSIMHLSLASPRGGDPGLMCRLCEFGISKFGNCEEELPKKPVG